MATADERSERLVPPAVRESLLAMLAYLSEPILDLPDDIAEGREVVESWLATITREAPLFSAGVLAATVGVVSSVPPEELMLGLARHHNGDWGNVDAEDWRSNDQSVKDGTRLLSAYRSEAGVKFWIITEADRSVTTFLLPDEY